MSDIVCEVIVCKVPLLIPVNSRAITSPPEMGPLLDVECKPNQGHVGLRPWLKNMAYTLVEKHGIRLG